MSWQILPFLIPSILALIVSLAIIVTAWRHRQVPGAMPLLLFAIGVVLRALGSGQVILGSEPVEVGWGITLSTVSTVISPTAWLLLVLEYIRGKKTLPTKLYMALALEPIIVALIVLSSPTIIEVFSVQGFQHYGVLALPIVKIAPIIGLHGLYSISLIMLGSIFLIARLMQHMAVVHRWQIALISFAIAMPVISNFVLVAQITLIDVTPLAHTFSGCAFLYCILRFQFLNSAPLPLMSIIDKLDDGVILVDKQFRITDINRVARRLLVDNDSELIGDPLPKLLLATIVDETGDSNRLPRKSVLKLETETITSEIESEQERYLELSHSVLARSGHDADGWLILLRDVSIQKTAEIQGQRYTLALEESKSQMQAFDAVKSAFFTNITHEFRTPLTLILGGLEDLFADQSLDVSKQQLLGVTRRNASRLLALVGQLLDLSKIDAHGMNLNIQSVDLDRFIARICDDFRPVTEAQQISLSVEIEGGLEPAFIDPTLFETVLINLISNAFKFTPAGGSIELKLESSSGAYRLTVDDSGIGISEQEARHVFERFYQLDATATRSSEGSGIGLALVKEILELHKASIEVRQRPGPGAQFLINLPTGCGHFTDDQLKLDDFDPEQYQRQGPNPLVESSFLSSREVSSCEDSTEQQLEDAKPLILLVEDNADMRWYIRSHLSNRYRVEEAVNGQSGLQMAQTLVPDLVISDVMMPIMDGFEFCEALKADISISHVPVIMLTAKAAIDDRLSGLQSGADDYLVKPFNTRELDLRVRNQLDHQSRLRAHIGQTTIVMSTDVATTEKIEVPTMELVFLNRVKDIIEAQLGNASFKVEDLAESLNIGVRQLRRKLSALTGESPNAMIRRMRIETAAKLLDQGAMTVTEIVYAVGFSNPSYFAERFREFYGVTPSDYLSQYQSKVSGQVGGNYTT